MLNPVSLRNGHGSLCLYSGILSSRAGTAAVKTIHIHDLVSDTIEGRRTAGITVQLINVLNDYANTYTGWLL